MTDPITDMTLVIQLPTETLFEGPVGQVTARGSQGSFSVLPRHIDLVDVLSAGVVTARIGPNAEVFFGVDGGVLTKRGREVRICAYRAFKANTLAEVRRRVEAAFSETEERDRAAHTALSRLEIGVVRRMSEMLGHGP